MSDILEEVLAAQGLSSVTWMVRLSSEWPGIVGPLLSGKTAPAKLRNGVLTVMVQNHSWAQELQLRKPLLTERIGAVLGGKKVLDIRFVTGPLPAADRENAVPRNTNDRTFLPLADPEGISGISDPETREILRSLSRKATSRKR
jgi:predicted nucleic acid-binding Zn ribbon protein